eukprot:gene865-4137_t
MPISDVFFKSVAQFCNSAVTSQQAALLGTQSNIVPHERYSVTPQLHTTQSGQQQQVENGTVARRRSRTTSSVIPPSAQQRAHSFRQQHSCKSSSFLSKLTVAEIKRMIRFIFLGKSGSHCRWVAADSDVAQKLLSGTTTTTTAGGGAAAAVTTATTAAGAVITATTAATTTVIAAATTTVIAAATITATRYSFLVLCV